MIPQKIKIIAVFCLLLFSSLPGTETRSALFLQGLEHSINEKYDAAISLFSECAQEDPADPAPHFFLATIWQSKMMDFETQMWNDTFLVEIERTIHLCETWLSTQPDNPDIQFYYASALAYKSFHISRQGQYLTGLRLGFQAVERLNEIVSRDSCYYDAYLGIGSYLYWRSYLTRKLTWLPFFRDQRENGIELIKMSYEHGTISKWAALSNLAWIYIKEERFEEAITWAEAGLANFSNSRFFLWPLGDAQFYKEDFASALATYNQLLQSVTAEEFNNRYNETVLHLKIAKCLYELNNYEESKFHAQMVLEIEPHAEVQRRLEEKRADAKDILKRIKRISELNAAAIE